jgi:hypothetical protein
VHVHQVLDATTFVLDDGRRIRQLRVLAPDPGTCEAKHATDEARSTS